MQQVVNPEMSLFLLILNQMLSHLAIVSLSLYAIVFLYLLYTNIKDV